MNEHKSTETVVEQFKEADTVEIGDFELRVRADRGGRLYAEIVETLSEDYLVLSVDEARGLRAWLDKVLP